MRQSRSEVVAVQQRCTELEAALATEKTWREEREQRQPDGESHGSARQLAAAKMVRLRGHSNKPTNSSASPRPLSRT